MDYYLFKDFDDAIRTAHTQALLNQDDMYIYEVDFNANTREFHGRNTFIVHSDGKLTYNRYAERDLHLEFYVNAGDWLNPNQEWIKILAEQMSYK